MQTIQNNPMFILLYQQDTNGDQTARTSGELGNRADRWWFVQEMQTKKPFVSKSYYTLTTNEAVTSIIFPVFGEQNELIGIISVREGCIFGALIGFVSFIAFSVVYAPFSMLLGWLIPSYTQGFLRFFTSSFGSIVVMMLLMILMAGISALFNGFAGLVTAYIYELVTGVKKENNQNNSIDFEIK